MPYKAQRQSLNQIGGPFDRGPSPDYGPLVDSLTRGASTLIQAAYARKLAASDRAIQADERQYQRGRDQREDARNVAADQLNRDKFQHDRRVDNANMLKEGYHEEEHSEPETSPIQNAMGIRKKVTQPAGPHYDLERSVPYKTATDRAAVTAQATADRQRERLAAQANAQVRGEAITRRNIRFREDQRRRPGSGVAGAMTDAQKRQFAQQDAIGLLDDLGGDVNAALDFLESPGGEPYRLSGVNEALIVNARARAKENAARNPRPMTMADIEAAAGGTGAAPTTAPTAPAGRTRASAPATGAAPRLTAPNTRSAADSTAKADWSAKNPPKAGESLEQYRKRYEASVKK